MLGGTVLPWYADTMIADRIPELKILSPEEKLALASESWDEIAAHPELFPVREDHVRILEERLREYERNPGVVIPWEEIKKRYLGPR